MTVEVQALTLDFWNTIADGSSGQENRAKRRHQLILEASGLEYSQSALQEIRLAEAAVIAEYEEERVVHLRATSAHEIVNRTCDRLNCTIPRDETERLIFLLQRGIDEFPPTLAQGMSDVLPVLARHYKLGIISDTLYAPGEVICDFLKSRNLYDYFDALVFSDETGVVKPHPIAFRTALKELDVAANKTAHIGDLVRTDIAGAKKSGLTAIQYTGIWSDRNKGGNPDAVLTNWLDLPDLLARLFRV